MGCLFVFNELARQSGIQRALGGSRVATLCLFLVLARIAHQGSRLSAVRWALDDAVSEVLGLTPLCLQRYQIGDQEILGLPRPDARQQKILSALKVTLTAP